MNRLLWVAVGAAAAVAGARRLGLLDDVLRTSPSTAGPAPRGTAATAAQAARTAFRAGAATAGAVRSLADARREFRAGMAEREEQLRYDRVGDVDVDALRAERDARRSADRAPGGASRPAHRDPSGTVPPAWHGDAQDREAARAARARRGWADEPTDDPADEDGDLPYSFY